MRHRRNNNKNKKQDGSRGRDVDESELVDEMPGPIVSDDGAHGRKENTGSALGVSFVEEVDAGSALMHSLRGSAPWHVLTSTHEGEKIAVGDVLVGLCYFPHRVRQMLYSYLDQAITQTSLFA